MAHPPAHHHRDRAPAAAVAGHEGGGRRCGDRDRWAGGRDRRGVPGIDPDAGGGDRARAGRQGAGEGRAEGEGSVPREAARAR